MQQMPKPGFVKQKAVADVDRLEGGSDYGVADAPKPREGRGAAQPVAAARSAGGARRAGRLMHHVATAQWFPTRHGCTRLSCGLSREAVVLQNSAEADYLAAALAWVQSRPPALQCGNASWQ